MGGPLHPDPLNRVAVAFIHDDMLARQIEHGMVFRAPERGISA